MEPANNFSERAPAAICADSQDHIWQPQRHWDAVADPVLVDLTIGGRQVKAVIQANRNGYFYTLDRANGKVLLARPYTEINWATVAAR